MTMDELSALCDAAIVRHQAGEMLTDAAKIMVSMPYDRRNAPRSDRLRLAGRAGPLGDLLTINTKEHPPSMIVCFDAQAVKQWVGRQLQLGAEQCTHGR